MSTNSKIQEIQLIRLSSARSDTHTADNQPFHLYQLDLIVFLNVSEKKVYNMGEFKFKFRTIAWPYEIYICKSNCL